MERNLREQAGLGPLFLGLFRRAAYPLVVAGAVGWAVWSIRHGVSLVLSGVVLTTATVVAAVLLELALPREPRWRVFFEDERADVLHFLLSERAYDLGIIGSLWAGAWLGGGLQRWLGLSLWPHRAPFAVQVLLAALLSDLSLYWGHRLGHTVPALWRLHAVHHTSPRLHWLSVWRSHPLDNLLRSAANVVPLAILGISPEVMALVAAFSGTVVILSHCDADLRTGWLDPFVNTPSVHRWHHAQGASGANFSPVLALWDHLFGTRFDARGAQVEEVGVEGAPAGYWAQMRAPWAGSEGLEHDQDGRAHGHGGQGDAEGQGGAGVGGVA